MHRTSLRHADAVAPWQFELEAGRAEAAWDAFLDRYRRLVFATIRHYVQDHDDVMDVFTWVCEGLRQDDFRRLRSFATDHPHRARFTTWLVAVVRNLCIDWLRQRDGRSRAPSAGEGLPHLQRRICEEIFGRRQSHAEAFEVIRSRDDPALTFGRFLKELAAVYRAVLPPNGVLRRELAAPLPPEVVGEDGDLVVRRESGGILEGALGALPSVDRVAVEMYVVDGLSGEEVARVLGLRNAKAVYNRVYRALETVRERLEAAGLQRDDL
jgi:RNA polymerase sigma factor (sigma-70 family)